MPAAPAALGALPDPAQGGTPDHAPDAPPDRTADRAPDAAPDGARGLLRRPGAAWRGWLETAVRPRLLVFGLLPLAGRGLVAAVLAVDVALGLLPVAFLVATSVVVGQVPAAVAGGIGSVAWDRLVGVFLLATAAFVAQQVLAPVQAALNVRMKRVVDEHTLDSVLATTLSSVSIAPMEDPAALDELQDVLRPYQRDFATPGEACGGSLALVARYLRLLALGAVVGVLLHGWAGAAVVGATLVFRYGQRGGLRKYSQVWRELLPAIRRSTYLQETAVGPGSAKEARIFGLSDWLADRYVATYEAMHRRVAQRRREVFLRPYLGFTAIGLALAALVLVAAARAGAAGDLTLTELALVLQAAMAALLLGEYYVESDVPTQYGMLSVAAKSRLEDRVAAAAEAAAARAATSPGGAPTTATDRRAPSSLPPGAPRRFVRFDGVRFGYPGSRVPVLDGLDLELPAGRSTAVVGVNGAGKTTLVKLLTRLHEPTAGRITVDGVDVADLDPHEWRRRIGVIFQDFVRFEFSAADNIAVGAPHLVDPDGVRRAAEQAGVLDVVESLPRGLDSPLARAYDGGADLSGGQWQRIAIARALYAVHAGARVLVLDEPTSALDVRAEVEFFDRFVELTRGVTSLLISHRFSSVRRADRIVVVDGGRVVEQGTHDGLMAAGGHYARLFRLQAERFAAGLDAEDEPAAGPRGRPDGGEAR